MKIDPQIPISKLTEEDGPEVEGHGWITDAGGTANPAAPFNSDHEQAAPASEPVTPTEAAAPPSDDATS